MKEGRDLAITLVTAAILLVGVSYLTQCSASSRHPSPGEESASGREGASSGSESEHEEAAGKPKSARELDEDEGIEEREKIQRVGRALQTIGANPEMRKTYGFPQ